MRSLAAAPLAAQGNSIYDARAFTTGVQFKTYSFGDGAQFEKASKDAKKPELKAWIDKTLPTLKEHHTMAQKLPGAGRS